ncbi:MAG: hypothetical protein LBV54_04020 [Puniceicoccales bacterium]|jgi:hypothetical protein|nr:hypothetical protein [Puniceicoccales bacterium]
MKTSVDRSIGAFAIFAAFALSLFAGFVVLKCHPVFLDAIGAAVITGDRHIVLLPGVSNFVFRHFREILWGWLFASLALAFGGWYQARIEDVTTRLGRQVLFSLASATITVTFLTLYLFAAAYAVLQR